jgi:RecA/RadA recombinase
MRLKPGVVYGDPRTTPGGKAMEFYASGRLALGRQKIMEQKDGEKEFVGQMISIQCVKSKFTKPFSECELRMSFNDVGAAAFDKIASLLDYLIDKKLITYNKPRVTWTDGKQYFTKALATKLTEEGAYDQLLALLPK